MENKNLKKAKKNYNIMFLLSTFFIIATFYFLMPRLFNFPKYFDNITFQMETIKIPLFVYFIIFGVIFYIFELIVDKIYMRKIDKFLNYKEVNKDKKFIINVRNDCMNYPYKFMLFQLILMILLVMFSVAILLTFGRLGIQNISKLSLTLIRLGLLIVAIWLILSVFKYYFLKQYLNIVLKSTYENNHFYKKNDFIINNSASLLIQILPMIIASFIIFIALSYSNTINVSSKAISTYYKSYIDELEFDKSNFDVDEMMRLMKLEVPLWDKTNFLFIIDYDKNVYTSSTESLSNFMLKYKDKYFYYDTDENGKDIINFTKTDNVIYESYGIDEHAYLKAIKDDYGRTYFIGAKYFAGDTETFKFLVYVSVVMLVIYTIILMYWSKSSSMNIKNVEKNMKDILSDKDILKKNFMPILSNDEIGNISYYYNKIQDKLLIQRDIMFKQEQLSVLGELAGRYGS